MSNRRDDEAPVRGETRESESLASDAVEQLASDFVKQIRRGERPSSAELEERFPDLSGEIEGLTKTLSILEEASIRNARARPTGSVINASGKRQQMLGGFRLIREISRGGMGIVYEAEQESLDRRVAIKVLPPSPLLTEVERARFQREGFAVARLHHSNIVPVFGTGEQDGVQYCVMQYIDGCSLDKLIAGMRRHIGIDSSIDDGGHGDDQSGELSNAIEIMLSSGVSEMNLAAAHKHEEDTRFARMAARTDKGITDFPKSYWQNVAGMLARIASALSHAHHQGVLHRDIKPANLLLDREGSIWLTDFGLAKLNDKENLTVSGNLVGTLRYTAPEQFNGEADCRSDVYGLGLTLYELCTLEPAFAADDRRELMRKVMTEHPARPRSLNPRIPRDLETIILKSIAPEPSGRYESAGDLAADLRNFLEVRPLIAKRQSAVTRGVRWCARHPLETALSGFALGMLLLFSTTATYAYFREARLRQDSDRSAARARQWLDRVYDSFLPDWTTASTVSAHGTVSVSPESARLLEELVDYYDDLARQAGSPGSEKTSVMESAIALRRVGLIYLRLGDFEKSSASYAKASARLAQFYAKQPSDVLVLEQARVLNEMGTVLWTARRPGESRELHRQALRQIHKILPAPKDHFAIQFEHGRTLYLFGRQSRGLGGGVMRGATLVSADDPEFDQSQLISQAVVQLENLLDRYPENLETRHLLALCYRENSDRIIDQSGQPADELMRNAIEILEQLVHAAPDHPTFRFALCTTLQWCRLGEEPSNAACDVVAARMMRSAELARQLRRERPDEWIYAAAHVEALIKMANVLGRADRLEEALIQSQLAIDSGTELAAKYRDSEIFQLWVGHARRRRGDLMRKTSDYELTLREYDLAIEQLEQLIDDEPSSLQIAVLKNLHRATRGRAATLLSLDLKDDSDAARRQASQYEQRLELAMQSSH